MMLGLVSGQGIEHSRPSREFSDPVAAAVLSRLEREERSRCRRPLRSDRVRRARPVSDFGHALARALGMEVEVEG